VLFELIEILGCGDFPLVGTRFCFFCQMLIALGGCFTLRSFQRLQIFESDAMSNFALIEGLWKLELFAVAQDRLSLFITEVNMVLVLT
jgi:hypothetical protein